MDLQGVKPADFEPAPYGWYPIKIVTSEAKVARSGAPMVSWTIEIRGDGDHAGKQAFDNAITSKEYKGAGFGVKKLLGMGINLDRQIEDAQLAAEILGLELFAELGLEPRMEESVPNSGTYDKPVMQQVVNEQNQIVAVPVLRNKVLNYSVQPLGGRVAAPAQPVAPVPAGYPAPGGYPTQATAAPAAPAGFAPPVGPPPGFAPQPAPMAMPAPAAPIPVSMTAAPQAPQAAAPIAPPGGYAVPPGFTAPPAPPNGAGVLPPHVSAAQAPQGRGGRRAGK